MTVRTDQTVEADETWVFAYGSLMWDPVFPFAERQIAVIRGYHRAFCIASWVYRGTALAPGLVLGLDRGGSCRGIAFRLAPETAAEVVASLDERELVTGVYRPVWLWALLADGRRVRVRAYVADREHEQYVAKKPLAEAAAIIRGASGQSGPNRDYVLNTLRQLESLGIRDRQLTRLAKVIQEQGGG